MERLQHYEVLHINCTTSVIPVCAAVIRPDLAVVPWCLLYHELLVQLLACSTDSFFLGFVVVPYVVRKLL